jgi:hypothetical protein
MTYGVIIHVPVPIEMYDRLHAELMRTTTSAVEGLLLHIGRPTAEGFDVIEVWDSKDQYDHYNRELVEPMVRRLSAGQPSASAVPRTEEFDVRGLVIPGAGLGQ